MNIALVHDWITGIAGDVRVLKEIHLMYPDSPIYCLYRNKKFTDQFMPDAKIIPSYKLKAKSYKLLLPLLPSAVESLDLSAYDLVISIGSIFAKGLILRPRTYHINYCHSPTRQIWDLAHGGQVSVFRVKSALSATFQHFLRIWDRQASTRVDRYIANSENVRARIKKYYNREAEVVYPPVYQKLNLKNQNDRSKFKNYFLIISRLYKHKNIDIAIKAFNKLGMNLVVIGDGPEYNNLKKLAGPTVQLLGTVDDATCSMFHDSCYAFILPQEEDFGIAPIEAMMHGRPVLALKRGGALEYIREGVNGLFFDEAHEAVLADGVRRMKQITFDSQVIRATAKQFSCQKFQSSFSSIITQATRSRATNEL